MLREEVSLSLYMMIIPAISEVHLSIDSFGICGGLIFWLSQIWLIEDHT